MRSSAVQRPALLFLSPVWPRLTGNGLAMRAAHVSRALAKRFEVRLAVLSAEPTPPDLEARLPWITSSEALPAAADTHYLLISRVADPKARLRAFAAYPRPLDSCLVSSAAIKRVAELARSVVHVHVMRLYLAPLLDGLDVKHLRSLTLDSDDDDAAYHRRRHDVLDPVLETDERDFERVEGRKYEDMKTDWLPRFDQVFVAAERDIEGMAGATAVSCLPNIVDKRALEAAPEADCLRLMFVGSLGYSPNARALGWMSEQLVPALERLGVESFELAVCGAGLVDGADLHPRLSVRGYVDDLGEVYADSDVALVPLTYGSGTPLKLLEAMALGVPVVATSFAAAAIGAEHGQHLLVADDADGTARCCIMLKRDPGLRRKLTAAAGRLIKARFSADALDAAVNAAFAGALSDEPAHVVRRQA